MWSIVCSTYAGSNCRQVICTYSSQTRPLFPESKGNFCSPHLLLTARMTVKRSILSNYNVVVY